MEQPQGVPACLKALRVALENLDASGPLGPTTEAVIDAAQHWYLSAAPQAQPVAEVQASNCKKPFFAHDPEGGTEWFATEADAIAHARASLAYYQDWAQSDGEWSGDVEHVKIGRVTHIASESGNEEDGYNYSIRPLAAEATPSPAPAQAQPVEAEQVTAVKPSPIPVGWSITDNLDGSITVERRGYQCRFWKSGHGGGDAIAYELAHALLKSQPVQPVQPVREPMSWDLFVAACEAEYGEEFCPNNLGDVSDEEKAELMRVVSIVERHHGIGSKGGAE